jgi:alanine racemase
LASFSFTGISAKVVWYMNIKSKTGRTQPGGLRTWIELDRKAIRHNLAEFRSIISKKTKLCAVVKSNAYGHSLIDFSKEMEKNGADWLAVDSVIEGIHLREEGIKLPILILGYTLPEKLREAVDANLSISISHFEGLQEIVKIGKKKTAKVHIKIDTGMHRQGFMIEDAPKLLKLLAEAGDSVKVEGLFTHFAAAKNPAFPEHTKKQLAEFEQWIKSFKKAGFDPIIHAASTAGTILFPESHFDMVRIGIGLYGLWPSLETKAFAEKNISLKPVLTWETIVGEIKTLKDGGAVGYDFTETLPKNSKIAILPVGYWHGYPRALSGIGKVLINDTLTKVVGRISMDMIIVDVTHIKNIKIGDEVILLGADKEPTAESIAVALSGSWYEILTRLNPLIKRFFV